MGRLKTGNPLEDECDYGPMARADLAEELQKQVQESVAKGVEVVLDGGIKEKGSAYFKPMILKNVKPGTPAYDEELFGPVAAVIVAKDAQDAIRIANDSRFGLAGSIWTKDQLNAEKLVSELNAGNVYINEIVKSDPRLPFGGVKRSGFGRELSEHGLKEFVNIKTVFIH